MLPTPIILLISAVGLVLLSVVAYISTGSFMSVIVILTLAVVVFIVLQQLGVLVIDTKTTGDSADITVDFYEKGPAPSPPSVEVIPGKVIAPKEVFYVSGNDYTYEDAAAVCAAYNADLATYDQVNAAYSSGAEWCGYGWTQGGMALYPTQDATWQELQLELSEKQRTACGRPGINGGYFDPANKFGVNCFGEKPRDHGTRYPLPIPGSENKGFQKLVDKFRSMIKRMTISPFNRSEWSESSVETSVETDLTHKSRKKKEHDKK